MSMLKPGDTAYTPITSHPDFPKEFRVGDYALFSDHQTCQQVVDAWNSYDITGQWPWRVQQVTLLPEHHIPTDHGQDSLF